MPFSTYAGVFRGRKILLLLALGFSSGLPLALTAGTLQAWLAVDGADMVAIGWFSLVGQPYTYKFLWSPLMDRYAPPFLGRRWWWRFSPHRRTSCSTRSVPIRWAPRSAAPAPPFRCSAIAWRCSSRAQARS
jgi:hypothetical protein